MGEIRLSRPPQTLTWHGVTHTVSEWAEIFGIPRATLYRRLNGIENADVLDEMLDATIAQKKNTRHFPPGVIQETYVRLSKMHFDYMVFYNQLAAMDGSAGFVARYGSIRSAPTNAISKPTEQRAMPELALSEDALYRRSWVSLVLYMIELYKAMDSEGSVAGQIKAQVLQWKALDGYTHEKIAALMNVEMFDKNEITVSRVRKYMQRIVEDVALEAMKRGLFRPQK
jgi:hypothetical protein